MTAFILGYLFKDALPNTSLCTTCTVRPSKPKCCSLEQRKVYCRAKQGERVARAQNPQFPDGFGGKVFICKIWGEGCRARDLLLIGGEVRWQCSRNLVLSLKLPSSTWVGALVPAEELKDIVMYIP